MPDDTVASLGLMGYADGVHVKPDWLVIDYTESAWGSTALVGISSKLEETYGQEVCSVLWDDDGYTYLAINPKRSDAYLSADEMIVKAHRGQHPQIELLIDQISDHLHYEWEIMSIAQRIELVRESGDEISSVLEECPPNGVEQYLALDWRHR